jgi:hypothetical protein
MFNAFTDFVPKEVAFSLIAYAAFSYFVSGETMASRVAMADHVPGCQANIAEEIRRATQAEIAALSTPGERAANTNEANAFLGMLRGHEVYEGLDILTGGSFTYLEGEIARQRRAAQQSYERAQAELRANAQARIDAAPDMCGCMARSAYEATRTEWAVFTGSLGIISPESVNSYGDEMRRHGAACLSREGV